MDAKANVTNARSRLPSRHVTEGPARAPHYYSYLAIAHETGIRFGLCDVAEIFKKTRCVADLKPSRRYVAKDMFDVGSISLLMKTLLDNGHSHGDRITVTGRTIAENLKSVRRNPRQDHPADKPITVTGGVVGLKGSLVPEGAVVKVAGISNHRFSGPARCLGHVGPEMAVGGPVSLLWDGNIIESDAVAGTLNVKLSDDELSGAGWKYALQARPTVGSSHPSCAHEKQCYADI